MLRLLVPLVLLGPGLALATEGWTQRVDANGLRRTHTQGGVLYTAADGSTAAELAELELRCRPGRDGSLAWRLIVPTAGAFASFPFDDFAGPNAPASTRAASRLALEGGLLRTAFDARQSGLRLIDGRFAFEVVQAANAAGEAALLADAISPQTQLITYTVRAEGGVQLAARFDAKGARAAVAEAMLGCGPVPVLDAAMRARWAGRPLADSGMLEAHAVVWRLAAALGARWPAVRARLAGASAGQEGELLYLLAPDADRPDAGVAAMFGPLAATVVILIDEGEVRRYVLDRAALSAPQAVREFVAARRRN